MPLVRLVLFVLVACALVPAQTPATSAPPSTQQEVTPDIEDNSFLIEEAYNQEFGVVQHIQNSTRRFDSSDYAYTFTQEWPFDPAPRNQFSYTIVGLNVDETDSGFGIGDIALHYRYQVVRNDRWALAPRFSVLLPTGDSLKELGVGGA